MRKPSIEQQIIQGLDSLADALEKGEDVAERLTCRKVVLDLKPTVYGPARVKETRKALGLSQVLFARFLGISPSTVRAWEQGEKSPQPIARRFMDEIRSEPERWRTRLKKAMRLKAVH